MLYNKTKIFIFKAGRKTVNKGFDVCLIEEGDNLGLYFAKEKGYSYATVNSRGQLISMSYDCPFYNKSSKDNLYAEWVFCSFADVQEAKEGLKKFREKQKQNT